MKNHDLFLWGGRHVYWTPRGGSHFDNYHAPVICANPFLMMWFLLVFLSEDWWPWASGCNARPCLWQTNSIASKPICVDATRTSLGNIFLYARIAGPGHFAELGVCSRASTLGRLSVCVLALIPKRIFTMKHGTMSLCGCTVSLCRTVTNMLPQPRPRQCFFIDLVCLVQYLLSAYIWYAWGKICFECLLTIMLWIMFWMFVDNHALDWAKPCFGHFNTMVHELWVQIFMHGPLEKIYWELHGPSWKYHIFQTYIIEPVQARVRNDSQRCCVICTASEPSTKFICSKIGDTSW